MLFGKRVDVRRREGERREGRKRWGEKGRAEIQRPREIKLEMTSNKREKKRGEEKRKRRGRRGRKRTERKEIKRNGGKGNVCVYTCTHVCTQQVDSMLSFLTCLNHPELEVNLTS